MDSTDNDTGRTDNAIAAGTAQSAGALLRAARLDRGMSIEEASRQLRLSVRQITALEEDDYDKLSSTTFLRGFVRNYAKLLQLDAASLLQLLQQTVPPPPPPTISYQIEGIPFPSNHKQGKRGLIVVGAVILALLLLIFEIYDGKESNKEKQPAVKMELKTETEQLTTQPQFEVPPAFSAKDADLALPAEPTLPAEAVKAVPQKKEIPPPPSPARQVTAAAFSPESAKTTAPASASAIAPESADWADVLRLVFEGEAWAEVKDSRGKLLLSRINSRGTEQVLHGKPPFSLAIGNASQVKLVYNNKPVDLAPHIKVPGGTARLSLN
ncbi:MAG: helix-turn-helix domain-containing protein [Nitrosospira sp.]|nr:helix-turn-helix domain-containing protein [Nitrosospira sp.]